ncbi:hypothetical protein Tco_0534165 [Tanacetum coccineum]
MWINAKLLWKEFISLHHPLIIDSESKNIQDHCQSLLELSLPDISRRARDQYGYIKNHKKTVKNGQARTRESEEYKAEARKVKPQSKSAKKSQSHKEAQVSLKPIATLAIRVRSLSDPTAKIFDPMIMTMSGED